MKIDNRIWLLFTVIVATAVLAGGWFIGAQPWIASAQAADLQRKSVDSQNAATQGSITTLKAAEKRRGELTARLASLTKAVPYTLNGSEFIRSINDTANSTGVVAASIKFSDPTPYASPAPPPAAAPAAASSTSASPSPSSTAAPAPSAAPEPIGQVPYTNSLITATNFVIVPVDIEVKGTDAQILDFIKAMQSGDRLYLVTGLKIGADQQNGSAETAIISGNVYVLAQQPSGTASAAAGASANG